MATISDLRAPEVARPVRRLSLRGLGALVDRVAWVVDRPGPIPAWASWLLLAAFAVQVAVLVPRHEPWFDEAQAWLLARDANPVELFTTLLRYEGSPGLWHVLLMVPAKLGLPYIALQIVGGLCAVAGAALIAFRSPFPFLIRAGLLFSFVIGYQYALVARSYTLAPLLLFSVALAWPARWSRPWRVAVLLGLLASVSLHGFLIAGSIAAVHAWETARSWHELDGPTRRRHLAAGGTLAVVAVAIVAVLLPPDDLSNAAATNYSPLNFVRAAPLVFNNSLTGNPIATLIAVVASGIWFWRTRTFLLWVLPTLALVVLSTLRYFQVWHDGLPFLVWVFALWVSLAGPRPAPRPDRFRAAALAVLAGTLVVQTVWWAQSASFDYYEPYSGSRALAEYLAQLDDDVTVYSTSFHAVGALPYLDRNVYDNFREGELPAYFDWSRKPTMAGRWIDAYLAQPDVIVWGVKFGWQRRLPEFPGYRQERLFDGHLYWKNRTYEPDAFVVYVRR